jgi:hypothetical protein
MRCATMCLVGLLLSGAGLVYSADDTKKDAENRFGDRARAGVENSTELSEALCLS